MSEDLTTAHALPPRESTFVGRTRELVGLGADLMQHRLITLVGPGGVGKSRLAAEVAEFAPAAGRGQVWWVDLKPLPPGAAITSAVLAALRLPDVAGRSGTDQLAACLGTRRALLVLDNVEHVLASCCRLVVELLGVSPSVVILATSRAPLSIAGEQVRELDPLELPDRTAPPDVALRSPAARLFLDRAREARPDFVLDGAAAQEVVELCHRLDGLPLALELAAAGAPGRSLSQVRAALARAGAELGSAAGPEGPHPALAACIRWSYDLLTDAEQVLFRRLSVFAGSFDTEAVAAVCLDGPPPARAEDALVGLLTASLVRRRAGGRLFLLETVRAFAAAELAAAGEAEQLSERHLGYALSVAARTERELTGASAAVVDRLAASLDDQRSALRHALGDADAERALRIATAAGFVLIHRGRYHEAAELLGRALAMPGGTAAARVDAHFMAGFATGHVADPAAVAEAARACRRFAEQDGRPRQLARAHMIDGWSRYHETPQESAVPLREALRWAEQAGDTWLLLEAPCDLAMQAARADDHATALAWVERGTGLARQHGNDYVLGWLLVLSAYCHLRRGALTLARENALEAGERTRSVGESVSMAYADYVLAETELTAGRPHQARCAAERGLATGERAQTLAGRGALLSQLAQARLASGVAGAAADLATAVRSLDPTVDPWEYCAAALALATHRMATGDHVGAAAPLDRAARTGQRLDSPWVAARAAFLNGVLAMEASPASAADALHTALALSLEHSLELVTVEAVEALALDGALRGRCRQAARLAAAADGRRAALGFPRSPLAQVLHERTTGLLAATSVPSPDHNGQTEDLGLTFHQIVAHLVRGRGTRGRPATGWTSLTTAEREVAELAAQGLSNPAIAARLLVAPGTVKTHLGRIYAKLAVANRTELAAAAAVRRARDRDSHERP